MNKRTYIILSLIIVLIPTMIWFGYFVGNTYGGILTALSAGDYLAYFGSIFTSIATIYAVKITIDNSRREIDKQNQMQKIFYKRELQRAYDEKLYDEVCQMARDIMIYLSLHELLSTLHPIIKSKSRSNIDELVDKARIAIDDARLNLMVLHKKQWYYYERLKNEGFFIDVNDDSKDVKTYFSFIYTLLNSLDEKLEEGSRIQQYFAFSSFFEEIDEYRINYQYDVTNNTTGLVIGVRNIFISHLDKYEPPISN